MAPFPTGPLAVFGRDLAQQMFVECAYLQEYERKARFWGRRTLCKGPRGFLSFASTLCDTVLSHWLAMCGGNATVAHTTRTKSHHYMWRGAGLGWMAPSNISLAVHYLKAKPDAKSGPNNTIGGEWMHTHQTVSQARGRAFPPLLYALQSNYSLAVSGRQRLMTSLDPDSFHWYSSECSFEQADLRNAAKARAVKVGRPTGAEPKPCTLALTLTLTLTLAPTPSRPHALVPSALAPSRSSRRPSSSGDRASPE